LPNQWTHKVDQLRRLSQEADRVSLQDYIATTGYDLEDVYAGGHCWSDMQEEAGCHVLLPGAAEQQLRAAIGRQLHVDDLQRLSTYQKWLQEPVPPDWNRLTEAQRRLLRMLVWPMVEMAQPQNASLPKGVSVADAAHFLWQHPQVCRELSELYVVLQGRVDHVHGGLVAPEGVPLQVHARYTRLEILSAFATGDKAAAGAWREGVRWIPEHRTDVFAFTLDKSDGRFSPTTRYNDYAISQELIHWESQSLTSPTSPTGVRYQQHVAEGSHVLLFARRNTRERAFWCLGLARYVEHRESRPMKITWRLEVPLPGDLFAEFAAAVA
jgi:hypothetical protein